MAYESFWDKQVSNIRANGFLGLLTLIKFIRIWKKAIPGVLISIPIILLVRLIRPLIFFRFGNINSGRIGHFALDIELYLAEKELGLHPNRSVDLFSFGRPPCNKQFANMCEKKLFIRSFYRNLWICNEVIPFGKAHTIKVGTVANGSRDLIGCFEKTKPHLFFNKIENDKGKKFLSEIGVKDGYKFVCLLVRDSEYMNKYHGGDQNYHNFRDCDIDTFKKSAIYIAEKGYSVLRMGKTVSKPLDIKHRNVFDYANSDYRCDFLDIWLMANAFFVISTSTGLDSVSMIFRRPHVFVNYDNLSEPMNWTHSVTVPKHLYWLKNGRHLTLKEYMKSGYKNTEEFENNGIRIKDLTSDEILDAVKEFELRLTGNWVENSNNQKINENYLNIIQSFPNYEKIIGPINSQFRLGSEFVNKLPIDFFS